MNILGIDTSTNCCAVGFSRASEKGIMHIQKEILKSNTGHSEHILGMIERIFHAQNITTDQLNLIVISIGPGSFTGLRIGMSVAKGLAFVCNIPIVGIHSLDAIGADFAEEKIMAAISSRKNEFYCAMYSFGKRDSDILIRNTEDVNHLSKSRKIISDIENNIFESPHEKIQINPFSLNKLGFEKFRLKGSDSILNIEPAYVQSFGGKRL